MSRGLARASAQSRPTRSRHLRSHSFSSKLRPDRKLGDTDRRANRSRREFQRIDHADTIYGRDDEPCFAHRTWRSSIAGHHINRAVEVELVLDSLTEGSKSPALTYRSQRTSRRGCCSVRTTASRRNSQQTGKPTMAIRSFSIPASASAQQVRQFRDNRGCHQRVPSRNQLMSMLPIVQFQCLSVRRRCRQDTSHVITREPCSEASSIARKARSRVCSGLNDSVARRGSMKVPTRPIGASTMPLRSGSCQAPPEALLRQGHLRRELFRNIGERSGLEARMPLDQAHRRQITQTDIGCFRAPRPQSARSRYLFCILSFFAGERHCPADPPIPPPFDCPAAPRAANGCSTLSSSIADSSKPIKEWSPTSPKGPSRVPRAAWIPSAFAA